MTQEAKGSAKAATSPSQNSNQNQTGLSMNSAPISTIIQFVEDSFLRQVTYWLDQRDHAEDDTYDEAVSLLHGLHDTVEDADEDIIIAFSDAWDSALEPEAVWADLLKRVGFRFFPDEAEGVLREFLDTASCGDA